MNTETIHLLKEHDRARRALLEDDEWPGLAEHLQTCAACRELTTKLGTLDSLTPKIPQPRPGLLAELLLVTRGVSDPRPGLLDHLLEVTRDRTSDSDDDKHADRSPGKSIAASGIDQLKTIQQAPPHLTRGQLTGRQSLARWNGMASTNSNRGGSERSPRILFATDQWGYGTVTMAMAIAEELDGQATRIFAGMGPGLELARRSSFEGLIPVDTLADPLPQELERELSACRAVVSVMNEPVARAAAHSGIPCVFVDCLLWMCATPPRLPDCVPYFQEAFPGSQEKLDRHRDTLRSAEIVGPLVTRPVRARSNNLDAVLVNFGGLASWFQEPSILVAYADAMAQCALAALRGWRGRVVVSAGRHVIDRMDQATLRALGPRVEVVDLSHDAYLAELRRSRLLITSAGMHALYEAFALGVPCLCLPSHNPAAILGLKALERHKVAPALDWNRLYGQHHLDLSDEASACEPIAAAIARFSQDRHAQARLVRHLRASMGQRRLEALRRRQARFYTELGGPGAPVIAARILKMVGDIHRATALSAS